MVQHGKFFKYEIINVIYYHIVMSYFFDEDKHAAYVLHLSVEEYRNMLLNNFGAKTHYNDVVFTNTDKLKQALKYLDELYESIQVANKLSGV